MNAKTPTTPWRGIHLLPHNDQDLLALAGELPTLAQLGVNLIIPEVNYNYAYTSHPEVRANNPISKGQAQAFSQACRAQGMRVIPQFQCLGHQSWAEQTFPLLLQYPEFDETPGQYANNAGIYCRSWCPQHEGVNAIVFDLFDELLEAFSADALHVGMDEVFLIASEHCPRCKGGDPAQLFAKAINEYHAHLVGKRGVEMLMWGDRLISDEATGYGEWEASRNHTEPAIDLIPNDIIICDWHYEICAEYRSIPIFLEKGFRVLPGGWRNVTAVEALIGYARQHQAERLMGYLCTTWGAVQPGQIAAWPPVLTAMQQMR